MELPKNMFSEEHEPPANHSINYNSSWNFLPKVEEAVGKEAWEHVCRSWLGFIVKLKFVWSSRLFQDCLAKQLECKKPYEIWCLLSGRPARFWLHEWAEITTLNCDNLPTSQPEVDEEEFRRFWQLLKLKKHRDSPCLEDLWSVLACRL